MSMERIDCMGKTMRNDKCWCGSNNNYKQCHMNFDEKLKQLNVKDYNIPSKNLIKNDNDIAGIRDCANVTRMILDELDNFVGEGIKTREIDQLVHDLSLKHDSFPATIGYQGYKYGSCISINDVICHGIPNETMLRNGDIVNVDISIVKNGYFSDASRMYCIGSVSDSARKLVDVAKECLYRGIEAVKPYAPLSDIAAAIEPYANSYGYSVVRDLAGHGIGLKLHEKPYVFHYVSRKKSMIMVPGMVFTIEPMINEKSYKMQLLPDEWTIKTIDGGLSAQWEHTILVTEDGYEVLT